MGRPGFNKHHWYGLSLEEGLVFCFFGKTTRTTAPLVQLWTFLDSYGPKTAPFHNLSKTEVMLRLSKLRDRSALLRIVESTNAKTHILSDVVISGQSLEYQFNDRRFAEEVEALRAEEISVVVSLLEEPLGLERLEQVFEVHHFPVEDIAPPNVDQVRAFAKVLRMSLEKGKKVVAHCLAGVGRTTTMLIAAHLQCGQPLDELVNLVKERNPYFQFKGPQLKFLEQLSSTVKSERAIQV